MTGFAEPSRRRGKPRLRGRSGPGSCQPGGSRTAGSQPRRLGWRRSMWAIRQIPRASLRHPARSGLLHKFFIERVHGVRRPRKLQVLGLHFGQHAPVFRAGLRPAVVDGVPADDAVPARLRAVRRRGCRRGTCTTNRLTHQSGFTQRIAVTTTRRRVGQARRLLRPARPKPGRSDRVPWAAVLRCPWACASRTARAGEYASPWHPTSLPGHWPRGTP